tara:strand:+ start:38856 stop:39890 length:1035 start_codon:yes stop_codon:yes gene_type:complete
MATTFKNLVPNKDIAVTRTLLNEAIPITGSIVSGTYDDANIKNYAHGMFQSVYDYPYLSSSANHIFDLTVGYSSGSALNDVAHTQNTKKINIYNQMAQVLVGYDATGSIREFDENGSFDGTDDKMRECVFINFSRLLAKDEVKKQSFTIQFGDAATVADPFTSLKTISDYNAQTDFRTNSPVGDYGFLYDDPGATSSDLVGLVYYQAGIAVLTASVFPPGLPFGTEDLSFADIDESLADAEISASCDGIRNRWYDNDFNNTTELNSSIFFCRASTSEFNYSSNPTYLSSSQIRVKEISSDTPVSYITTVGLYSEDNELLAVAKLSEPLKKDPTNEITLRVRLDY